jgi:hypothetical protein
MPIRKARAALVLSVVAVLFVGAVTALLLTLRGDTLMPWRDQCSVAGADGETVRMTPEQVANAATIALVGRRAKVSQRGVTIALATAMQESKLRNLDHGDRDSLGLFQQRPSQGWGTAEQVRDPVHASERFYAALKKIDGYADLALTDAAQRVQRSGYPDAYAKHEPDATVLAGALTGRNPAALACDVDGADGAGLAVERLTESGLTPRARAVRADLERAAGKQSLGGFAPGGVSTGHIEGSAHYDGRAIDVLYRPVSKASKRRGWSTAHYLVANAERLHIATVIYDDRIWTARRSGDGWRPYVPTSGDPENPINRHLDHVHVDVLRGG